MAQTNVQAFSGDVEISSNLAVDTNTLFVDSVGNGKVGVRTSNPKMEGINVDGSFLAQGGESTIFSHNLYYNDGWKYASADNGGAYMRVVDSEIQFWNAPNSGAEDAAATVSQRMTIDVDGNVGIGTTDPLNKLDVMTSAGGTGLYIRGSTYGTNNEATHIRIGAGGGAANAHHAMITGGHTTSGSSYLTFSTIADFNTHGFNPVERMRITNVGYVGIGTASPGARLQVGDGQQPAAGTRDADGSISVYGTGQKKVDPGKPGIYHRENIGLGVHSDFQMSFEVNGQTGSPLEAMRINQNALVGIGTGNPIAKLHVNGGAGAIYATAADLTRYFNVVTGSSLAGGQGNFNFTAGFSVYGTDDIGTDATFVSTTRAITASDERIKRDIVDVQDDEALQLLRLIEPKKYKYKDFVTRGDAEVYGFIAQQISNVFPEATQLRSSYIPNIYETANVASNTITFTNFNTSNLDSNATTLIRTKGIDGEDHDIHLVEVIDEHTIRVEEDLSEWTGSIDENGNIAEGDQIFVYGQEVDDFIYIKKDSIWTVATSALQEVDRQLQAEKTKVTTLETQLASVLARLDALESA
jgi:hypothetical protein